LKHQRIDLLCIAPLANAFATVENVSEVVYVLDFSESIVERAKVGLLTVRP
jgi:hypothetical protein